MLAWARSVAVSALSQGGAGTVGRRMLTVARRSQIHLPIELDRRRVVRVRLVVTQLGRVVAVLGRLGTIVRRVLAVGCALGAIDRGDRPRQRCGHG